MDNKRENINEFNMFKENIIEEIFLRVFVTVSGSLVTLSHQHSIEEFKVHKPTSKFQIPGLVPVDSTLVYDLNWDLIGTWNLD